MMFRAAIPHHAVEVFEYAMKHGYVDLIQEVGPVVLSACPLRVLVCAQKEGLGELMDRAAEEALASPLQDVFRILSAEMFVIWVGSIRSIDKKLISSVSISCNTTTNGSKSCETSKRLYQVWRAATRKRLIGFVTSAWFTETLLMVQGPFETWMILFQVQAIPLYGRKRLAIWWRS